MSDPTEGNVCVWRQEDEGSAYVTTQCNKDFVFNEDSDLIDTGWMRYCCFCGRPARVAMWLPEEDEDE